MKIFSSPVSSGRPMRSRAGSLGRCALALAGFGLLSACAGPPKVMTSHQYLHDSRSAKTLLQESGATAGEDEKLFNYFLRVCSLEGHNEKNCKDTLVLENVTPRSMY